MKINQTYQFSDEDIKMLKIPLPYNPCEYCGGKEYCCGCQKEREYVHKINKYKELGIYDIACNIQEVANCFSTAISASCFYFSINIFNFKNLRMS